MQKTVLLLLLLQLQTQAVRKQIKTINRAVAVKTDTNITKAQKIDILISETIITTTTKTIIITIVAITVMIVMIAMTVITTTLEKTMKRVSARVETINSLHQKWKLISVASI